MLILCSTNRALECLHVQSHILLSISYRIITHSKHDAWSEWATCSESLDRTSSCCIGTLTPSRKKKIHGHRLDELVRSLWLRIQWGHQRILLLSSCDFDQKVTAILAQIPIHRTNEMMRTLWLPRCEGDVSCAHFAPCSAPSPPTRFMAWFMPFSGSNHWICSRGPCSRLKSSSHWRMCLSVTYHMIDWLLASPFSKECIFAHQRFLFYRFFFFADTDSWDLISKIVHFIGWNGGSKLFGIFGIRKIFVHRYENFLSI